MSRTVVIWSGLPLFFQVRSGSTRSISGHVILCVHMVLDRVYCKFVTDRMLSSSSHAWVGYLPGQDNSGLGQVRIKFRSIVIRLCYNWVVTIVSGRFECTTSHEPCVCGAASNLYNYPRFH